MNRSENITALAAALCKAQAAFGVAVKDSTNPAFRTRYADLGAIWDAVRPSLHANGLAVIQNPTTSDPGFAALETLLLHESGEYIGTTAAVRLVKDDPQGYGSGITYLRRYCLAALLGVVADDDDGNLASGQTPGGSGARPNQTMGRPTGNTAPATKAAPTSTAPKLNSKQAEQLEQRVFDALIAAEPLKPADVLAFASKQLARPVAALADLTLAEAKTLTEAAGALTTAREGETEGHTPGRPERELTPAGEVSTMVHKPPADPIGRQGKGQIAAQLKGRFEFDSNNAAHTRRRLDFLAWLVGLPAGSLKSSGDLTAGEGAVVLERLTRCALPSVLLNDWQTERAEQQQRQAAPVPETAREFLGN